MKKTILMSVLAAAMLSPLVASAQASFWLNSENPREKRLYMALCLETEGKKRFSKTPNVIDPNKLKQIRGQRSDKENCECDYKIEFDIEKKLSSLGIKSFEDLRRQRNNAKLNNEINTFMKNYDMTCGWKK